MRTLVTGATGLVGNNVVRLLLQGGQSVRVLVREGHDPRPLDGLDVERVPGDVRDPDAVAAACRDVGRIVHAAAYVHIGWSQLAQQRAINVEGTRRMGEAALANGARLIHVSSVDALGIGSPAQPADERTPRGGKTPCSYVITKSEAEDVVRQMVGRGLDAVIVNPGFMVGPWDWKPSSGRMLVEVGRRFAPLAPTGGCSICDVRDVATGILSAAELGQKGENYILAGYNLSYLEIWRLFARIAGSRPPLGRLGPAMRFAAGRIGDLFGRFAGREPDVNSAAISMSSLYHYYSSDRARAELNYQNRPLDESVCEAWQWFQMHGYV
ncbi:MAG: NAD-dependent epimerase/dehydratase family protein [Pirellulaceae bacterium]